MVYNRRTLLVVLLCLSVVVLAAAVLVFTFKDDLSAPQALYAEALDANPSRAAALYSRLAERLPLIQEYGWLWAAGSMDDEGEKISGLLRVTAYYSFSPSAYLAFIDLARAYAGEQPELGEAAYREALALNDDPALRLELARFLESQGAVEKAYIEYRRLLDILPDAFKDMRRTAPDPLSLSDDLLEKAYYSDALEVLEGGDIPESQPLKARALFGLERYEEAASAYTEWLQDNPHDAAAQLGLAKVLVYTGRAPEALEIYRALDTNDSRLELAKLLESEDTQTALDLYLDSPYPVAWWNATWILEEDGQLERALTVYQRIAEAGVYFSDDAAYRMYTLGQELGDEDAVQKAEALLDELGPNWLAMRLNQEELDEISEVELESAGDQVLEKVHILESLGRADLADMELSFAARFTDFPPVKLRYLRELDQRGEFFEAYKIAQSYIDRYPDAPEAFWRFSYPRPYAEYVAAAADTHDIDPLLIWAVMRVESAYDQDALSLVGARGLMQLMPATQDWIAEQLEEDSQPGDAYLPEENIRMGAWFLSYLLDYFEGDLELAILAYNAGAASVEEWQADPMVENRDDLIRWIWYGESREYLQRVSLAYRIYRELYE